METTLLQYVEYFFGLMLRLIATVEPVGEGWELGWHLNILEAGVE